MTSPPLPPGQQPYGPYPPGPPNHPAGYGPYPTPQQWAPPARQPIPVVVRPAQRIGMAETLMWFVLTLGTCGLAVPFWIWRVIQAGKPKIEYR